MLNDILFRPDHIIAFCIIPLCTLGTITLLYLQYTGVVYSLGIQNMAIYALKLRLKQISIKNQRKRLCLQVSAFNKGQLLLKHLQRIFLST